MSDWIEAVPNPPDAKTLPGFRFFAVLGTWMEADVVAATIRNAFAQGCERVFLVDNDSPDDTVAIALREGAELARSFHTERHDEATRLEQMNSVVTEASEALGDAHVWWLFLDADEFPHGPAGKTLRYHLATLDTRFRVVGARFFNHYPSGTPHFLPGRHPLDCQPLCEELSYPMCPSRHRKHPLQRFDRGGAPIRCGVGFHLAHCAEPLFEPTDPVFLHHFPFREEHLTRARLAALWSTAGAGTTRARDPESAHMLARFRSLDAVYSRSWSAVENFIVPPAFGVSLQPWESLVEPEHRHVARWNPMFGAWKYENVETFAFGDDTTYAKGIGFLDGHGTIEDWGCGFAHARKFVTRSRYVGIDGSSPHADRIVDLADYVSDTDCIFIRHVLEHNHDWRRILVNAVASFRNRMVVVLFTPLGAETRQIGTSTDLTTVPVPEISFRREDLTACFGGCEVVEESLRTATQYGTEHVFYLIKKGEA